MDRKKVVSLLESVLEELKKDAMQDKIARARINGHTLEALKLARNKIQSNCNHRKGGMMDFEVGIFPGDGDDPQFALAKHQLPDGSWFIKCLRCGKEWKEGDINYERALNAPTRNVSSTSIQFMTQSRHDREANGKSNVIYSPGSDNSPEGEFANLKDYNLD
jgi:hypothetical protein